MQELVDVHIFAEAHAILDGLVRQECSPALQWCAQHRARLRKIRSKLEFRLRIQVSTVHCTIRHSTAMTAGVRYAA